MNLPILQLVRDPKCDVVFDPERDEQVSRAHTKICLRDDNFWIGDLGSRDGTYVNNQRVSGPVKLIPGDIIRLGQDGPEFEFQVDSFPRP